MSRKRLPNIPQKLLGIGDDVEVNFAPILKKGKAEAIFKYNCSPNTITIDGSMTSKRQWISFFHELLHILEQEGNFHIKHKTLDKLSVVLLEFFLRNDWKLPGEK